MSAGKVILYMIGAGGLLAITYGFFWAIGFVDSYLGEFRVVTYSQTVWIMSGVLAFLIVLSAIAKDHARLEMLSSGGFLVYTVMAYTIGCTILSAFMPYSGFGMLNVQLAADLTSIPLPGFSVGEVTASIVYLNTVSALFMVIAQAFRFFKTFVKSMKEFKEVPAPR
ncbi:MAG: hypothetical protein Q6373_018830 [Candidatus Sigynarchaeota archaeon]